MRAFGRLLWTENDLINRHYQATAEPAVSVLYEPA